MLRLWYDWSIQLLEEELSREATLETSPSTPRSTLSPCTTSAIWFSPQSQTDRIDTSAAYLEEGQGMDCKQTKLCLCVLACYIHTYMFSSVMPYHFYPENPPCVAACGELHKLAANLPSVSKGLPQRLNWCHPVRLQSVFY